jgi:pimeloyl-ACP methyl ester carboxylesterase
MTGDWILLRGLTREARHWGSLPDRLRDAVRPPCDDGAPAKTPVRIVTMDLPGNGEYASLAAGTRVEAMLDFVRAGAQASALRGPYRLMAMSLGGMIATAWAQRHPREIERLVLINTSMRPFSSVAQRLRPRAWADVLRLSRRWGSPLTSEHLIHRLTCNARERIDTDLAAWVRIRLSAPVSRANALRQLLAAARFRAGSTAPACPTLILSSRGDQLVHPSCSAQLASTWHVPHIQHPWAGHDLPHDDPEWLVQTVRGWMAETMSGAR